MCDEPTATLGVARPVIDDKRPQIISRSEAKAVGLKKYFTGKPCPRGHICEKWIIGKRCLLCAREYIKVWREKNARKIQENSRRWYEENQSRRSAHNHNRLARLRGSRGRHAAAEVRELLVKQKFKCANSTCRISIKIKYHKDHIMPLDLGGSNDIRNIQLLCPTCNLRKGARHPIVWAQENGRLI